jgi:hypothetical protein
MLIHHRLAVAALWLASLVAVGALASAQAPSTPGQAPLFPNQPRGQDDDVITGTDLGFRPEGWNGSARTGTFVVRINGQWVEAQVRVKPQRVTR